MKRVRMIVAYDGTAYHGWQFQLNGLSIEEVLNEALSALLKEEIKVIGASRTDAGVHALGNVAVFDTKNRMPADKICFALNQRLPQDIRIQASEEVPLSWHPRKQNCTKTYVYRILNRRLEVPTLRLYTYFCYFPIDVEKMRQAAAYLVGEHDFKSFCTPRTQAEETVRTIYSLTVERGADDVIDIRITGNGFLYNMVRIIAGTLLRVGTGLYGPEHVEEILDARDRQKAGPTLPAKGLTMIGLDYEKELPPEIKAANKYWEYRLIQREILKKGKAYLLVKRCAGEEFDRLVSRLVHQAARNGARKIYVTDQEGWEAACQKGASEGQGGSESGGTLEGQGGSKSGGALEGQGGSKGGGTAEGQGTAEEVGGSRIQEGQRFGHYQLYRSHCYLEMEKKLGEPEEPAGQTETRSAMGSAGGGSAAGSAGGGSAAGSAGGGSAAGSAGGGSSTGCTVVSLRILEPEARQAWLALYNEAFFAVTGSATYDEETLTEQEKDGTRFFWVLAGEEQVGVLALILTEGVAVSIDILAIKKAYEGLGYGGKALRCAESCARDWKVSRLSLLVADDNERARRLYERNGYRLVRRRPDFFCAESDLFGPDT